MAAEIQCDVVRCKFNDSGECTKPVIAIKGKECIDYDR